MWFTLAPPSCSSHCIDIDSGAFYCFKKRIYAWFVLLPPSVPLFFISFPLQSDVLVLFIMISCFSLLNHYVSCRGVHDRTAVALEEPEEVDEVDKVDELEAAVQKGGVPVEVSAQDDSI